MRISLLGQVPLGVLLSSLKNNVKAFVREEVELVKSEMAEKASCYGRNAISLVIGGIVAYAGFIVFLGGLGMVLSFCFQKLGLNSLLAAVVGLSAIGLIVILVGFVMIFKGVKAFSSESLIPERTIATIQHLKGTAVDKPQEQVKQKDKTPKRSPLELEQDVLATEDRIGQTLKEIAYRTSPARTKDQAVKHIRSHPYQWSFIALGGGLLGSYLVARKFSSV